MTLPTAQASISFAHKPLVGRVRPFWGLLLVLCVSGCSSPQLSWKNLWDREAAHQAVSANPLLAERVADVHKLAGLAKNMSTAEQTQVSELLAQHLGPQTQPALRRAIAKALGSFRTASSLEGLRQAVQDSDPQVREEACQSLARIESAESFQTLAEVLHSDTHGDVRLAAARALGKSQDPQAVKALGRTLDDSDPALQYLAIQSLKHAAGRDLGNDVRAWKQYAQTVDGSAEPAAAIANRPSDLR